MMPPCAASRASAIWVAIAECLVERKGALRNPVGQRWPLDQLHHQCDGPARLLEPVNLRDVRMVQCGEHFGFALKSRQALGIRRHRLRQHLDGHRALQVRVGGAYTSPMPPTPIRAAISYGPRRAARRQRHRTNGANTTTAGFIRYVRRRLVAAGTVEYDV